MRTSKKRTFSFMLVYICILELNLEKVNNFRDAAGCDILKLMNHTGVFPKSLARTYFHQLFDAIEFRNKAGIDQRDI